MIIVLFIYCCILFADICMGFLCQCPGVTLVCNFLVLFVWFMKPEKCWLHRQIWEVFPALLFLGKDCRIDVIYSLFSSTYFLIFVGSIKYWEQLRSNIIYYFSFQFVNLLHVFWSFVVHLILFYPLGGLSFLLCSITIYHFSSLLISVCMIYLFPLFYV